MTRRLLAALTFVLALTAACTRADEDKPLPARADPAASGTGATTTAPAGKVEVVHADRGEVAQLIKAQN